MLSTTRLLSTSLRCSVVPRSHLLRIPNSSRLSSPIQCPPPLRCRWKTTNTATATEQQGVAAPSSSWSSRWQRIAAVIRYVRIPFIVVSVYTLGYQQGVIDCTKEPVALQRQILQGVLVGAGCRNPEEDVMVVSENDVSWHSRARHHQVAAVGSKVVATARRHVEEELQAAIAKVRESLPDDATPDQELVAMDKNDTVQYWYQARMRLEGEAVKPQPWQFLFLESDQPNAFVTEILPRRFFITTAMLQVAQTPDELAVVLGHEVSHLILGHVSDTNRVETALRTIEVLLLSMDPTAGLVSVAVMGLIYAARQAVSAAHSRENEGQADALGLLLAAKSCYDTVKGSKVMYKMHQMKATGLTPSNNNADGEGTPRSLPLNVSGLLDSHPPTLDRWERMKTAAMEGENYRKHPECANIASRFFNSVWSSSKK